MSNCIGNDTHPSGRDFGGNSAHSKSSLTLHLLEKEDGLAHPGPSVSLVEGHQDGHGAGILVLRGDAQQGGLDQPGEEMALGGPQRSLLVPTKRLARRWSQDLYRGGQWKDEKL